MTKKSLVLSLVLFIFVFINCYSSQNFDKSLYALVYSPTSSNIVEFLSKIKSSKYYHAQLNYFSNLSPTIAKEIAKTKREKSEEINRLKNFLKKNANARDVLIKIAILNAELKNTKEAKEYYQQAKKIDPETFINDLEI